MMENYKIKVNNEAESKDVQELFFEFGYKWSGGQATYIPIGGFTFITAYPDEMLLAMGWGEHAEKEITIPQLRGLVQSKPTEQALISGADAKLAWAKGEDVQYFCDEWTEITKEHDLAVFDRFDKYRLKPRTITLNVEIPAPFEPSECEEFYVLSSVQPNGYIRTHSKSHALLGAWRTESEIKQVVAALRGALKNG